MKKNKTVKVFLLIAAIAVAFCGCSPNDMQSLYPSETDYSKTLDINTPEGLAQTSAKLYQSLINGDIDTEQGFQKLYEISSAESKKALDERKGEFIEQLAMVQESYKENPITEYRYSKTELADENNASICRIQINKSGDKYYFKQDYVKENGTWKIKGDNAATEFRIKDQFLFWYF